MVAGYISCRAIFAQMAYAIFIYSTHLGPCLRPRAVWIQNGSFESYFVARARLLALQETHTSRIFRMVECRIPWSAFSVDEFCAYFKDAN
jgi:hypothetical protein